MLVLLCHDVAAAVDVLTEKLSAFLFLILLTCLALVANAGASILVGGSIPVNPAVQMGPRKERQPGHITLLCAKNIKVTTPICFSNMPNYLYFTYHLSRNKAFFVVLKEIPIKLVTNKRNTLLQTGTNQNVTSQHLLFFFPFLSFLYCSLSSDICR